MASHKCACGSRAFVGHMVSITCDSGAIIGLGNIKYLECVRCPRKYVVSTDPGKKVLQEVKGGSDAEKQIMQLAVDGGYFELAQGGISNYLLTDEEDRKDIERLDLKVDPKMFEGSC